MNKVCHGYLNLDELHKVVAQGNKVLKTKVPPLRSSLTIYLANEETERILFRPIKVSQHCDSGGKIHVHVSSIDVASTL